MARKNMTVIGCMRLTPRKAGLMIVVNIFAFLLFISTGLQAEEIALKTSFPSEAGVYQYLSAPKICSSHDFSWNCNQVTLFTQGLFTQGAAIGYPLNGVVPSGGNRFGLWVAGKTGIDALTVPDWGSNVGILKIGTTSPFQIYFNSGGGQYQFSLFRSMPGSSDYHDGAFVLYGNIGPSDYWSIKPYGLGDAGQLLIDSGDDGNEPIIFGQYFGTCGSGYTAVPVFDPEKTALDCRKWSVDRMRISSNGNVGIWSETPSTVEDPAQESLEVRGPMQVGSLVLTPQASGYGAKLFELWSE